MENGERGWHAVSRTVLLTGRHLWVRSAILIELFTGQLSLARWSEQTTGEVRDIQLSKSANRTSGVGHGETLSVQTRESGKGDGTGYTRLPDPAAADSLFEPFYFLYSMAVKSISGSGSCPSGALFAFCYFSLAAVIVHVLLKGGTRSIDSLPRLVKGGA